MVDVNRRRHPWQGLSVGLTQCGISIGGNLGQNRLCHLPIYRSKLHESHQVSVHRAQKHGTIPGPNRIVKVLSVQGIESIRQISQYILNALEPYREADEIFCNSGFLS